MAKDLTPTPVVVASQTMDFPEAIRKVINGKRVARESWDNVDYGLLKNEWLTIFTKGEFRTWLVSQGDMEGNDWIVLEDITN